MPGELCITLNFIARRSAASSRLMSTPDCRQQQQAGTNQKTNMISGRRKYQVWR